MHGGAKGSGAPNGERTKAARSRRAELLGLIKSLGETAEMVTDQLCREA